MKDIDLLIKNFFKKKEFDSDELSMLKQNIIDKLGYKYYKPYESIINLHLLKFIVKANKPEKNPHPKKLNTLEQNIFEQEHIKEILKNKYKDKKIFEIANLLEIPPKYIISFYKKVSIDVDEVTIINDSLFDIIYFYINKRESVLKSKRTRERIETKPLNPYKKDKKSVSSNTVYDKLLQTKTSVKLIYIRSK